MPGTLLVNKIGAATGTEISFETGHSLTFTTTQFKLTGGTAGQAITTDGSGNLTFADVTSDPTMGGDLSGTASNAQIVAGAVGTTELAATLDLSGKTVTLAADAVATGNIDSDVITSREIATNAVTANELADNAVDTNAIIDAAVTGAKILTGVIPTMPTVTSVTLPGSQTAVAENDVITVTGTGYETGITAKFKSGGTETLASSVTRDSATQLTVTMPALAEGTYDLLVINGNGLQATSVSAVGVDGLPIFNVAAGSIGSFAMEEAFTFTLDAVEDSATVTTYALTSGALPSGITLNTSTGVISGTLPTETADTTYNFTITATDAENQTASRAYSMIVSAGYEIEYSCRFDANSSSYLSANPNATGSREKWTYACWYKICRNDSGITMMGSQAGGTGAPFFLVQVNSSGQVRYSEYVNDTTTASQLVTTGSFKDPNAWYQIILAVDTTLATADDRQRMWINGVEQTNFSSRTNFSQNFQSIMCWSTAQREVGRYMPYNSAYFDGYMAELHIIDGQQITDPTIFGRMDSNGQWQTKKYTGTYGTTGMLLEFKNAGNNGQETSGTGSHMNQYNLNGYQDQLRDTPYNNFCVLNYWVRNTTAAGGNANTYLDEGNLHCKASTHLGNAFGSIGVSSGKWYWECLAVTSIGGYTGTGVAQTLMTDNVNSGSTWAGGNNSISSYPNGQTFYNTASGNSGYASWAVGDIVNVALDLDNGKIFFGINGTWQSSGDPIAGTNPAYDSLSGEWTPMAHSSDSNSGFVFNFGQDASFAGSHGSSPYTGTADSNGVGEFITTPPTGFLALCNKNMSAPTVANPGDHFNTVIWTGDGSASRAINGMGFQPDLVWVKCRSAGYGPQLQDSIRGANKTLLPHVADAEGTHTDHLLSFDSDGFTVGSHVGFNSNTDTYVGWGWKAGGASVANTDGTIASTVSANTTAGFSIVGYTSPNSGSDETIGHGLSQAPEMVIVKNRDSAYNWDVWSPALSSGYDLRLNDSAAQTAGRWSTTIPTASLVTLKDNYEVEGTDEFIAYCFHSVEGYSRIGVYTGNGNAFGPFIYLGFKPAYFVTKRIDSTGSWPIRDIVREPISPMDAPVYCDTSGAENDGDNDWHISSNGMSVAATGAAENANGGTYLYWAFAETPFKGSSGGR